MEGAYAAGRQDGEWSVRHPGGALHKRLVYRAGVPDGPVEERDLQGRLVVRGQFVAGAQEGEWTFYLEDGTPDPDKSGTYKQGVKQ
jgi:antitoxin component YwqK of YwqJK toxin-antitoxin module